jgi:hypothetical protein
VQFSTLALLVIAVVSNYTIDVLIYSKNKILADGGVRSRCRFRPLLLPQSPSLFIDWLRVVRCREQKCSTFAEIGYASDSSSRNRRADGGGRRVLQRQRLSVMGRLGGEGLLSLLAAGSLRGLYHLFVFLPPKSAKSSLSSRAHRLMERSAQLSRRIW